MVNETQSAMSAITKGSLVEVTSDEEGFKGAWYRAIVEATPSTSRRNKLFIRYLTLLKPDGVTSLRETVDSTFIRPLPPDEMVAGGKNFEEGDVVDVRYRDGWWIGVVRKLLQDGRYVVYFDNPPDVIEFERKFLRPHLHWIDGKWVRLEKQQSTKSIFSSGTTVELKPETEDLCDVWVPAIVIKENEDGTIHVKYKSLRNDHDVESKKVDVHSGNIRPTPLPCNRRQYTLHEHVDVRHESGWREGFIARILSGKRYTVVSKRTKESVDCNVSDLRPSVEWKDEMWHIKPKLDIPLPSYPWQSEQVVDSKKSPHATKDQTEARTPTTRLRKKWGDHSTPVSESYALSSAKKMKLTRSSAGAKQSVPSKLYNGGYAANDQTSVLTNTPRKNRTARPTVQARHGLSTPSSKCTRSATKLAENGEISIDSGALIGKVAARVKQQVTEELGGKVAAAPNGNVPVGIHQVAAAAPKVQAIRGILAKFQGNLSPKKALQTIRNQTGLTKDSAGEKESREQKSNENSHKRKRGRPRKFIRLKFLEDDQNSSEKAGGASVDPQSATNDGVIDDDQPLSTWVGVNLSSSAMKESRVPSNSQGEKEIGDFETLTTEAIIVLPFVKRSPLWDSFESMEVFKRVPQRPHFSPLLKTKEECREGLAIGMMVTFFGLLEKVNNLKSDDPINTLESIKGCLIDLENNGFDPTLPLTRINELLSIKEKRIQTLEEIEFVKKHIEECDNKKRKCEEEIEGIRRKIVELQSHQETMMNQKESMEIEKTRLESEALSLDQIIQNVEEEFLNIASAPWKSL